MSGLSFPQLSGTGSGLLTEIPDREVLGNVSGTSALPSGITSAQLTGLINAFTTTSSGAVPASNTTATDQFLNASGVFTSASGGSYFWISTNPASSSLTLDFTSSIDATYVDYEFIVENLVPSINTSIFSVLYSTNSGGTWITTNYSNSQNNTTSYPITQLAAGAGRVGHLAGQGASGRLTLYNPSGVNFKMMTGNVSWQDAAGSPALIVINTGNINTISSAAVNGIRFQTDTGVFASGNIRMYGIRGS